MGTLWRPVSPAVLRSGRKRMIRVERSVKSHRAILVVGVVGDMGQNQSSTLNPGSWPRGSACAQRSARVGEIRVLSRHTGGALSSVPCGRRWWRGVCSVGRLRRRGSVEVGRLETLELGRESFAHSPPRVRLSVRSGLLSLAQVSRRGMQCAVSATGRLLSRGLRRRPGRWLAAAAQQDDKTRGSHSRRGTVGNCF